MIFESLAFLDVIQNVATLIQKRREITFGELAFEPFLEVSMTLKAIPIQEKHALQPPVVGLLDIPAAKVFKFWHGDHVEFLDKDLLLEVPRAVELVRLRVVAVCVFERAVVHDFRYLEVVRSFRVE